MENPTNSQPPEATGVPPQAPGSSPANGDIYKHPNAGFVVLVRRWNEREWVVEEVATKRRSLRFIELMERMPANFCVPIEQPWPPTNFLTVERCEHGTPKGYLCRKCQEKAENT